MEKLLKTTFTSPASGKKLSPILKVSPLTSTKLPNSSLIFDALGCEQLENKIRANKPIEIKKIFFTVIKFI